MLQKAAIVVRSKPPCENRGMSRHAKIKGTYDDVRVLDTFSQRISSFLPNSSLRAVASLPYRAEARPSEGHETEDTVGDQYRLLNERPGVVRRVSFSVEDPVRWGWGDFIVPCHGECGHGLTKRFSETSLVGEQRSEDRSMLHTRGIIWLYHY